MIIIQHMLFSPDTLYVRSFWNGYCDEIRLWALFEKGGDIHAGTCLPATRSPADCAGLGALVWGSGLRNILI
jgi:hypothetical protein